MTILRSHRKTSSRFTLIELLVVISLLGILFSFGGIKVASMIAHERFQNEVESVKALLERAEELHLAYQKECYLVIERKNSELEVSLHSFEAGQKKIERAIILKEIREIEIESRSSPHHLVYSGERLVPPHWLLTLHGKRERKEIGKKDEIKKPLYPLT